MLHSLSELTVVVWIVAEVGSVLFLITDHACKECRLLDLRKLAYVKDRLCGLVVRVSGYRYRGPGFDPRRYQIF